MSGDFLAYIGRYLVMRYQNNGKFYGRIFFVKSYCFKGTFITDFEGIFITDFMSTFFGIHLLIHFIYASFISVIVKYLICTKLRMFKKTLPCALMPHSY